MVESIPGRELQALRLRGTSNSAWQERSRLTLALSFALAAHASVGVLISAAVRRSELPDAPTPPVLEMVFAAAGPPPENDKEANEVPAEPTPPADSSPPAELSAAAEPPKPEPLPVPTSPPAIFAEKRPEPPARPAPRPSHPAPPRSAHANPTKLDAPDRPEASTANPATARTAAAVTPSAGPIAPAPRAISPGWQSALAAWLNAHKTYPEAARALGEEGSAGVRFTVERDGRLLDFALIHGTGSARLDEAVRELLRDARLPPFPPEMAEDKLTVTVQIRFSLQH